MIDLADVEPGFADASAASQRVFRDALEALAHPGRIVEIAAGLPAARALLLTLLDGNTPLWLSRSAHGAHATLRFHTGCPVVEQPAGASFALVARGEELPPLDAFAQGSEEYPERSATLVVEVSDLVPSGGWRLEGPGIRERGFLTVRGLPERFAAEWAQNHARFPRGVDVFLSCGSRLCGLPRTTRLACT